MLPFLVLMLLAVAGHPSPAPPVYSGREAQLHVSVPRIDETIVVDGVLDEAPWAQAAVLSGFSQYAPADGRPADDSTEVLVWYSATAIHFGIRAHAAPGTVHATLADRDRIDSDDSVQIFLSTFNDGRQALMFGVNPLGVQTDGALVEGDHAGQGGFSGLSTGRNLPDLSPDYTFDSKGRVTETGYEVEMRIPLRSLKFQQAETQAWGLHVIRRTQATGHDDSWAPAIRGASSFLAQGGRLEGLTGLRPGLVLDLNPVVTTRVDGGRTDREWAYQGRRPEFGANVRWGITSNLTLNGTVNPDFSQVEADASQFTFDPRQALFFPEKRPFFLDGLEQFSTPNRLIYTRRIVAPVGAAKLTGKTHGLTLAGLSALDDEALSHDGRHQPLFNVLRIQRDVGAESRIGFVYTDREDGPDSNRVVGIDARLAFRKVYTLQLQGAGSRTVRDGTATAGPLFQATLDRNGHTFGLQYELLGISDRFSTESGLITRGAIVHTALVHRLQRFGHPGAFVENWVGDVALRGTWDYDAFFRGDSALEEQLHVNNNFTFRGGWKVGGSVLIERFGYDEKLYTVYAVEREAADGTLAYVPFVGTPWLPNLDYLATLDTPQFQQFSATFFWLWGRDENFFEWAPADILFASVALNWRPTDQLRVTAGYQLQQYRRATDDSVVGVRRIPRVKAEYQVTRSIFVRGVAEYDADRRDALRDDSRTNLPLAILNPDSGAYERAGAYRRNRLRTDWLFSYQPTPGTVVFAGYGSALGSDTAVKSGHFQRASDGFFVKLSYLWQL